MTLSDQRVRDRIRFDLDTTLIIEAAAGTGKTSVLVSRIVSLLAGGRAGLGRIVALTFTDKAAAELKLRLRSEIERARDDAGLDRTARERLTSELPQLEEARIGTIHSFCADLLRERPVEAGVDPQFEVAPSDEAEGIFDAAFDRWFREVLAAPGEGMARLLRRRGGAGTSIRQIAASAARALIDWRDFDASWCREAFDRDREIDALVEEFVLLGDAARDSDPEDWLAKGLSAITRPVLEAIRLEPLRVRDYDALEAVLVSLGRGREWVWRGRGGALGGIDREVIFRRRDELKERLDRFRDRAGANLAPLLREELWPVVARYEDLKRRAGKLDFLDLLLVARNMVRDNPAVRADLQRRISYVLVDEFQDTDPLQAEILMLLVADDPDESDWTRVRPVAGKLFLVGDPKQSIYRFRRADVSLYQRVKRRLIECGAALEYLRVSFRAVPEIQRTVNAAFAPLMPSESDAQPAYSVLEPFRTDHQGQPGVVVLPVPEPYGSFGTVTAWAIEDSLPEAVGAYVRWLLEDSGWTVTERDAPERRVPILPRHICILFRRLNTFRRFNGDGGDVTRPYLRALEARHVPHVLVRGGSFSQREEVEAIRNLLGAIERGDDELLVYATLRGPLFALLDQTLLEFRAEVGHLDPLQPVPAGLAGPLAQVHSALEILRRLHYGRNRRPIAETISEALRETRALAGIQIWPTGDQALANVMRVMELARRFEGRSGATSFRGFVDQLEALDENQTAGELPVVEEGTEAVRIMTVHRAKGLEFPVVVLADLTCHETASRVSRFIDPQSSLCALRLAGCAPRELLDHEEEEHERDREEAIRLIYVAATRARDLLVVPAVGDGEYEGWLQGLNPVIYPEPASRRAPRDCHPQGCPAFGDDSVLTESRPPRAPAKFRSVAPGLHLIGAEERPVVWWDPSRLRLDVRQTMGLRQYKLLEEDESREVSHHGVEAYQRWARDRDSLITAGSRPTIRVETVIERAQAESEALDSAAQAVVVEGVERDPARPRGPRFGTLVHATLMRVDLGADPDQVERAARNTGELLGACEQEVAAAIEAVSNALAAPVMVRAARADRCLKECPLTLRLDDGTVVEGVADLAFLESAASPDPRWTVVDFKTDFDLAPREIEYRAQIGLYVRAFARSTSLRVRGVLLRI